MNRFPIRQAAVIVLSVLALAGCSKNSGLKDTPPEVQLFSIKNVYIEYEYGGAAQGTKKQYIANYGMYQRDDDNFTVSFGGVQRPVVQLVLKNDSVQYTIDPAKKEGTKSPIQLAQMKEMIKTFTAEQKKCVNVEMMKGMGGQKKGTETILGKQCDVYEVQGFMTVAMWQGVPLRTEMTMGGATMSLKARKIDENPSVSIALFEPEKDVKITAPPAGMQMPAGHPPVSGGQQQGGGEGSMPAGHPSVEGGQQAAPHGGGNPHGGGAPAPMGGGH